jgi:hypothetical protein
VKYSKDDLNIAASILGIIIVISGVCDLLDVGSKKVLKAVNFGCTGIIGILVQMPATKHPTTEDLEEKDGNDGE